MHKDLEILEKLILKELEKKRIADTYTKGLHSGYRKILTMIDEIIRGTND